MIATLVSLIPPAPPVPRFDVVHSEREGCLVPAEEVLRATVPCAYVRESTMVREMRREREGR